MPNREELLRNYSPMVIQVATAMARRCPPSVDADDLITVGFLGLMDALDRYEDDRAASFASYARTRVRGAMIDELRRMDWVPRSVRSRAARIDEARGHLRDNLGREASQAELARALDVAPSNLEALERGARIRKVVSLDDPDQPSVADEDTRDPFEAMARAGLAQEIRQVLAGLSERDRTIVDLLYYRELSQREVAEVLGVTESRVCQLHTRLKERLRTRLAALMH